MKLVQKENRDAFSLMELLVGIGIVIVLAALLIPGMGSAIDGSKTTKSLANLKQIGAAVHMYINDNNGQLPRADGAADDAGQDWPTGLRQYGASHRLPEPNMAQNPLMLNPAGYSPEYSPQSLKSSYCMNGNLQVNTPPPSGQNTAPIYPIPLVKVETPTKTVLFGDSKYAARAMNFGHLEYRNNNKTTTTVVFVDGHAEARRPGSLSYEVNFANPPVK